MIIRRTAPTDLFVKALKRAQNPFDEQFDIGHVKEKFPKLEATNNLWLAEKLGRAITQRRQFLRYCRDHHLQLEDPNKDFQNTIGSSKKNNALPRSQPRVQPSEVQSAGLQPTIVTKASSISPALAKPGALNKVIRCDTDSDDARSSTTLSRPIKNEHYDTKIPELKDIKKKNSSELQCPFCWRMTTVKSQRAWV